MKRTGLLLAATAAALLAGCGLGAPNYPEFSQASYKIEGRASAAGGAPTHTVIYRNGPLMRVEAVIPQYGEAAVVFDQSTNAAYVLTTAQAMAPAQPTAPAAPGVAPAPGQTTAPAPTTPAAPTAPAATPTTPGVVAAAPATVGVAVRLADTDAPQPMESAWAALGEDNARSVGSCEVAGEQGHEWTPREASAGVERVACITDDGIVLRVTENNTVLWEATSLQRGEQDTALFGVPAGYQLIDPQAVAESVSENMQQLDSVTGAPPTAPAPAPQPAPAPRG
jgi:hypothetical protein